MNAHTCPLCTDIGGELIADCAPHFRVIRALDANFPAFYRLIWQRHAAEFSDLNEQERAICMQAVATIEGVLRQHLPAHLQPSKINLASLGNVVPHLHWHIIARFDWDSHYPDPVWAAPRRAGDAEKLPALQAQIPALDTAIALAISPLSQ
jgi:diadenosine tetraphosphate (Ap4A) HIT family hydrolase